MYWLVLSIQGWLGQKLASHLTKTFHLHHQRHTFSYLLYLRYEIISWVPLLLWCLECWMIACLNKLCKNLSKFIHTNAFSQINKYDIREYLKSIPTTIYDNMTTIPQLTRMSHSRLWQFLLVNFRLKPHGFF